MNILLLSTIYPLPTKDNQGTAVCHYFAKEWANEGHNVKVIHYQAVYPFFFYWVAKVARNLIAAKTGAVVYTSRDKGDEYEKDGVKISRIPLFKPIPHGQFTALAIEKSIKKIIRDNETDGFVPDIIVGHFPNPQIEVVAKLKKIYSFAKTAIVIHGTWEQPDKIYGNKFEDYYKLIDKWGFRSITIKECFENRYGKVSKPFICYSGVPSEYITKNNSHTFDNPVRNFIYVGEMIQRKYPATIIESLVDAYPDKDFHIDYVGSGGELRTIQSMIDKYDVDKQVNICGRIPRNEIVEKYDSSDCMIMISKGEAYGLVYLEAMARGCITVASKKEGFDGVIIDGVNGFLCEAGNAKELSEIIRKIKSLSKEECIKISEQAIATAKKLTDKNVADMYLNDLMK